MQDKEIHERCVKYNHPVYMHKVTGCVAQIQSEQGGKEVEYCNCSVEAGIS